MNKICKICYTKCEYQLCDDCQNRINKHLQPQLDFKLRDTLYTLYQKRTKNGCNYKIIPVTFIGFEISYIKDILKEILDNTDKIFDINKKHLLKCKSNKGTVLNKSVKELFKTEQECLNANKNIMNGRDKKIIINYLSNKIINKIKDEDIETLLNLVDSDQEEQILSLLNLNNTKSIEVESIPQDALSRDQLLNEKQIEITNLLSRLLKSELAIESNVNGLNMQIINGYINTTWLYANRTKNDIKE